MTAADKAALKQAFTEMGDAGQVRLGLRFMLLQWRDRALGFVAGALAGWWLL